MFDENIDVAAIMREIKASVMGQQDADSQQKVYSDEIGRITDYIVNVKKESERYLNIGSCLPACKRFPAVVACVFRAVARIVRKSASFIIRDQIVVNHNMNALAQALMERDDSIMVFMENQRKEQQNKIMELEHKIATQEDQIRMLQKEAKELEHKIEARDKMQTDIFDETDYLNFENKFRGKTEDITLRLEYYINNYIRQADASNCKAIDIGCGRGEWMQLMNAKGYQTTGVDINEKMVSACGRRGLHAVCETPSHILKKQKAIQWPLSAFQVIEHIARTEVKQLIAEAKRVLTQHGLLLLEAPNIQNIEVGASFYLDPTHINPMHPNLLLYMAETAGFKKAEIVYWNKDMVEKWRAQLVEQDDMHAMDSDIVRTIWNTLENKIYVSPDYALIAEK